jgi:hypothetical protein
MRIDSPLSRSISANSVGVGANGTRFVPATGVILTCKGSEQLLQRMPAVPQDSLPVEKYKRCEAACPGATRSAEIIAATVGADCEALLS